MARRSSSTDGLPKEADELFSVAPAEFVRRRDAIARALRKAGRGAAAAEVARLRKPPPVVWVANQLARRQPEKVRRLIETVEQLRRFHLREPRRVPEASAAQRAALKDVLASARDVSANLGPGLVRRLSDTLMGAAVDREASAALAHGRLRQELPPPGLEAFTGERIQAETPASPKAPAKVIPLRGRRRKQPASAGDDARAPRARENGSREDRRREERRVKAASRAAEREARAASQAAARATSVARARARALDRIATARARTAETAERAAQKLRTRLEALEQRAAQARRAANDAATDARRARPPER